MAKQRRPTAGRSPAKKAKASARPALAAVARSAAAISREPERQPGAPPPPPRRPAFYEALAIYESGVRAMQRHDFASGLASFRSVIQGYPSERELVERAHLFVRVCERETAKRPPTPQTPTESVYAATVALNAGDPATALSHLNQALQLAPESDHAHYVMSLALIEVGDKSRAYEHLTRAISLNPEIRSTAIQEPDLAVFHDLDILRDHHDSSSVAPRRRLKPRR